MNRDLTIIIPTRNEIKHIERSVRSAFTITQEVFVVDSGSTDGTGELAERLGAKVYQYEWTANSNFARKMNWAFENLPIKTTWAMRLDADEYLEGDWTQGIDLFLSNKNEGVNGANINRWLYFLGRKMRHRDHNPRLTMRIIRIGRAEYEDRWLDEQIDLKGGGYIDLKLEIADNPSLTIDQWTNKHINYSLREALMCIDQEIGLTTHIKDRGDFSKNIKGIKKQKDRYSKSPKYWRCFFYFCYRYFLKLGFLDGREGFLFDFYQGWWYRTIVDTRIDEFYAVCGKDPVKIKKYALEKYKIDYR